MLDVCLTARGQRPAPLSPGLCSTQRKNIRDYAEPLINGYLPCLKGLEMLLGVYIFFLSAEKMT